MDNQQKKKCSRCGCEDYKWDLMSFKDKLFSGCEVYAEMGVPGAKVGVKVKGQPAMDNKSSQAAYRNCKCGHHFNYHS